MKRLGMYTGKIYDEDYDRSKIKECCVLLSDEYAENEAYISLLKAKNALRCNACTTKDCIFDNE